MRRAWKWTLAGLGIPALCVAILWVDSYYRAVAAIRAEEARLAKDVADFRARMKPGLPVDRASVIEQLPDGAESLHQNVHPLPCPLRAFLRQKRAKLEDGHSSHGDFYDAVRTDLLDMSFWSTSAVHSGDRLITALSVTHHLARECGYDSSSLLYSFELRALWEIQRWLATAPPPDDLRRFAADLDRCLESRPPFAESFEAEHLMNREEVLRVLGLKADPSGFICRPPGWREFFSWRILLVKALKELDREHDLLRQQVASDLEPRLARSALLAEFKVRHDSDREALAHWTAGRTAVAIARFRARQGRFPDRLDELAPEFLPRSPRQDPGGDRLSFKDGTLALPGAEGATAKWVLTPK